MQHVTSLTIGKSIKLQHFYFCNFTFLMPGAVAPFAPSPHATAAVASATRKSTYINQMLQALPPDKLGNSSAQVTAETKRKTCHILIVLSLTILSDLLCLSAWPSQHSLYQIVSLISVLFTPPHILFWSPRFRAHNCRSRIAFDSRECMNFVSLMVWFVVSFLPFSWCDMSNSVIKHYSISYRGVQWAQ